MAPPFPAIVGVLMLLMSATTSAQPICTPPDTVFFGSSGELVLNGDSERLVTLERIGLAAIARQSLGILIPGLTMGNILVHLYDIEGAGFLSRYDDIADTERVGFYVVCERDGAYTAIPGTVSRRSPPEDGQPSGVDGTFIGLTFRPPGTVPDITLRGDLRR